MHAVHPHVRPARISRLHARLPLPVGIPRAGLVQHENERRTEVASRRRGPVALSADAAGLFRSQSSGRRPAALLVVARYHDILSIVMKSLPRDVVASSTPADPAAA